MSKTLTLLATIALSLALPLKAAFAAPAPSAPATAAPASGTLDIAALQRKNELAQQENAIILRVNAAVVAQKWQAALSDVDKLIALEPLWDFYEVRGNASFALAKDDDAIAAYGHALDGALTDKTSPPARIKEARARMLLNRGNSYVRLKANDKAMADFAAAAPLAAHPATAYFNLCVMAYNAGDTKRALTACDAAIKADPAKADAYFIKGSVLYADATVDKSGTIQVPPAALAALKKYLALEPKGGHAEDVKAMLAALAPASDAKP